MNKLIIIGASGHGRVIADIAKKCGYTEIAFLDDAPASDSCGGYPILGGSRLINELDADWVVGIGSAAVRRMMHDKIKAAGKRLIVLVHPNAVIGENVSIGAGSVVMAGAVVNPGVSLGEGCIVNTCASVDHDCIVGDYVHVSVGTHLAGTVTVGDSTWIGIGSVVSNNISITSDCIIGAGAVVVEDIEEAGTYVGVPAGRIK